MKKVMLVAASAVFVGGAVQAQGVLYDNGPVDGTNGYSNATVNAFGARRTILDDFVVPAGGWTLQGFEHRSVWGTPGIGPVGLGLEITIWSDAGGAPGGPIDTLTVTGYSETQSGNVFFSREESIHFTDLANYSIGEGTYWFEATIVGPENNFWLVNSTVNNSELWVNYDDLGGLASGTDQFGSAADANFILHGVPAPGALALIGLAGLAGTRRRRG